MPPDEPSPESEKEANAKPEAAAKVDAKAAERPAEKTGGKPAPKAKVAPPPDPGAQRTRSIIMMVLATLALTAVLTLVAESVFHGPTTAPSANLANTAATATTAPTTSSGDVPPSSGTPRAPTRPEVQPILVAVTFDHIEVDGIEVEKIAPLIASKAVGNLGKLQSVMDLKRGGGSVGGPVALAVEQGVPRNVLKSVFGTLALAGFRDVHLVGARGDGGLFDGGLPGRD